MRYFWIPYALALYAVSHFNLDTAERAVYRMVGPADHIEPPAKAVRMSAPTAVRHIEPKRFTF